MTFTALLNRFRVKIMVTTGLAAVVLVDAIPSPSILRSLTEVAWQPWLQGRASQLLRLSVNVAQRMRTFLGILLTAAFAAYTATDLRAEEKTLALLLQDAAQVVGRSSAFQDRKELTRYLEEAFAVGTSELEVRKKVFGMLEHLAAGPQTHVSVGFRENWLSLSLMRIENLRSEYGGPQQWDLAISFLFGPDRRLKSSLHTVSFGRYNGPLDEVRKKENSFRSEVRQ